jgi:hypothetical protein
MTRPRYAEKTKDLADVRLAMQVKYTEADGKNTASQVSITAAPAKKEAAPAAAPAKAAPAEKAPAKKKAAGY